MFFIKLFKLIEFLIILMMILSMYVFYYKFSHFLIILMSLEMFSLVILLDFFMLLVDFMDSVYILFMMVIFVCEGVIGLSLLIFLMRVQGDDIFLFHKL
uniref:NADH dehydrogenase subunit 4L n=1 Tax=Xenos vesparum TaxID=31928 RepID=Q0QJ90_9NEOP|nr:NADH dehydrogenase subunit 4L [Xenos vesparum]CAL18260.1 NADH dehydrogenase subunit 4L [Xenos vesparum]